LTFCQAFLLNDLATGSTIKSLLFESEEKEEAVLLPFETTRNKLQTVFFSDLEISKSTSASSGGTEKCGERKALLTGLYKKYVHT